MKKLDLPRRVGEWPGEEVCGKEAVEAPHPAVFCKKSVQVAENKGKAREKKGQET